MAVFQRAALPRCQVVANTCTLCEITCYEVMKKNRITYRSFNHTGEELIAPVPQPVVQPAQPSPLLTSQQKAPSQPTVPPTTQPAPPTVIEPVKFSPPPPSGAVTQTSQAMAGLNLSSSTQQNVSQLQD